MVQRWRAAVVKREIGHGVKADLIFGYRVLLQGERPQKDHICVTEHQVVGITLHATECPRGITRCVIQAAIAAEVSSTLDAAPRLLNQLETGQEIFAAAVRLDAGASAASTGTGDSFASAIAAVMRSNRSS